MSDLRVGIVGHLLSKKSTLVHHYLTGSFVEDESAEGGRFKKEVVVDGQSYLLLIRDEGGSPEIQVCRPFSSYPIDLSSALSKPTNSSVTGPISSFWFLAWITSLHLK